MEIDSLLKEEYFFLQKNLEDFDNKFLTIKTWSITGSMVVVAAGLSKNAPDGPRLMLLASAASFLFWIIEAIYQGLATGYDERIREIETYFADPTATNPVPLQAYKSWSKSKNAMIKRGVKLFISPAVFLPHLVIVCAGFILFKYHI